MCRQYIVLLATLAAATFLTSCAPSSISKAESATPDLYKQYQAELATVQAMQPPVAPPSLVNLSIDQSGSMTTARVNHAGFQDLTAIFEILKRQGGIFAISAICDRSDRPLIRTTIPEPPRLDLSQVSVAAPPEPPRSDRGNPFHLRQQQKDYEEALQANNQKVAQARAALLQYTQQLEQHQANVAAQIEAIQPEIEAILQHPRTCQATDIQSAVQRTNWFFAESTSLSQPPRKYAVFITDGLDTFSNRPAELHADRVILVNGTQDVGIFNNIDHQRFESPQAAINVLAIWMQEP